MYKNIIFTLVLAMLLAPLGMEAKDKKKEKKDWEKNGPGPEKSDKKKSGNPQKKNGGHYHNNRRESRPRRNGDE